MIDIRTDNSVEVDCARAMAILEMREEIVSINDSDGTIDIEGSGWLACYEGRFRYEGDTLAGLDVLQDLEELLC